MSTEFFYSIELLEALLHIDQLKVKGLTEKENKDLVRYCVSCVVRNFEALFCSDGEAPIREAVQTCMCLMIRDLICDLEPGESPQNVTFQQFTSRLLRHLRSEEPFLKRDQIDDIREAIKEADDAADAPGPVEREVELGEADLIMDLSVMDDEADESEQPRQERRDVTNAVAMESGMTVARQIVEALKRQNSDSTDTAS